MSRALTQVVADSPSSRLQPNSWRRSPLSVAVLVFVVYGVWLARLSLTGYDVHNWMLLGREFVSRPHAAQLMHIDPRAHYIMKNFGNDGQFYYYIAVDPIHAQYFVDTPGYRYQRILYPMLARGLSLGNPDVIPYALIAINWLAVAGGTLAVAAWMKRKLLSPWLALVYGLHPALLVTFERDLSEPLSYALIAAAAYLYSFGGKRQLLGASACFALSAITRDKAIAFGMMFAAALFFEGLRTVDRASLLRRLFFNARRAALFAVIVAGPYVALQLFLRHWLHVVPAPTQQLGGALSGASSRSINSPDEELAILCVYLPAAVCAVTAVRALLRGVWRPEVFFLLVTILFSVVFINADYLHDVVGGIMRVSIGVVLMALLCIPAFDTPGSGRRWWLRMSASGWLLLNFGFAAVIVRDVAHAALR